MAPETTLGRVLGSACAVVGVVMVALPISVISSTFNDKFRESNQAVQGAVNTDVHVRTLNRQTARQPDSQTLGRRTRTRHTGRCQTGDRGAHSLGVYTHIFLPACLPASLPLSLAHSLSPMHAPCMCMHALLYVCLTLLYVCMSVYC
jgi:hypothetical protein